MKIGISSQKNQNSTKLTRLMKKSSDNLAETSKRSFNNTQI